jgi:hypothetical protein
MVKIDNNRLLTYIGTVICVLAGTAFIIGGREWIGVPFLVGSFVIGFLNSRE